MEITVKLNHLRIAPRKVRKVINSVRGKKASEAETMLSFLINKPAKSVLKLLQTATAAAKHDFQLDPTNLYISKIFSNEGPKLKRWRPVSRGSAHPLWKRTSHITLTLNEIKPSAKKRVHPVKSREAGLPKAEFNRARMSAKKVKISSVQAQEKIKETTKKEDVLTKKEKPRFERKEFKKEKKPSIFKRVFRRKAM